MNTPYPPQQFSPERFIPQVDQALNNQILQKALQQSRGKFIDKRQHTIAEIPEWGILKQRAQQSKTEVQQNWAQNLQTFCTHAEQSGGFVHFAQTPEDLNAVVLQILQHYGCHKVIKGKSMATEESHLNAMLEQNGKEVIETDLGEYIIQLAKERPSHIIAPALHKTKQQVADLFTHYHRLGERDLTSIQDIVLEARKILREHFLSAQCGITGANCLIAENGGMLLVTNEGNGDLCATVPPVHIVITGIEKLVPTLQDAHHVMRLLARSATGQHITSYTSMYTPQRSAGVMHYVLLDGQRSSLPQKGFTRMLDCIRCGACLNHCPVYGNVGGHAYGSTYPGPMGAVLTPLLENEKNAHHLPQASTFCGRCAQVCPMDIPLVDFLRQLRERQHTHKIEPVSWSFAVSVFMWMASKPWLFRLWVYKVRFFWPVIRWASAQTWLQKRIPFMHDRKLIQRR